jgi:hypothetical protein
MILGRVGWLFIMYICQMDFLYLVPEGFDLVRMTEIIMIPVTLSVFLVG